MTKDTPTPENAEKVDPKKESVTEEPKVDEPEQADIPNINDILGCVKNLIPRGQPKETPELCKVHIVGTPEMILKILKIE